MSYREDHEAALQRAAALERKLAEAESRAERKEHEVDRLREELAGAKAELATREAAPRASRSDRRPTGGRRPNRRGGAYAKPVRADDGSVELSWNRTLGVAGLVAGIALALATAFNVQDPGDPFEQNNPWWFGPLFASPVMLLGVAFALNRSRWSLAGRELVVSNRPIPLPRTRRFEISRIEGFGCSDDNEHDRLDLVVTLAAPPETVILRKGLSNAAQGQEAIGLLERALAGHSRS